MNCTIISAVLIWKEHWVGVIYKVASSLFSMDAVHVNLALASVFLWSPWPHPSPLVSKVTTCTLISLGSLIFYIHSWQNTGCWRSLCKSLTTKCVYMNACLIFKIPFTTWEAKKICLYGREEESWWITTGIRVATTQIIQSAVMQLSTYSNNIFFQHVFFFLWIIMQLKLIWKRMTLKEN